jgi:hypothetical protein
LNEPWVGAPGSQQPEGALATPPAARGSSVRPAWLPIVGALALALITGIAGFFIGRGTASPGTPDAEAQQGRLQAAYDHCTSQDEDNTLELADNGATIVIDTRSEYGSTAGMECVLGALTTPESIKAEIGRTTAMMGTQDADNNGIHYSWSYHPDNGVNMVITVDLT